MLYAYIKVSIIAMCFMTLIYTEQVTGLQAGFCFQHSNAVYRI